MKWRGLLAALVLGALLTACAPLRLREDDATLRAQRERETTIAAQTRWQLSARIAVSNGDDGGNAELDWHQDGERYDLSLRAPVTGKHWRLHGDARSASLEGVRDGVLTDRDPARLLAREVDWQVPVAELEYWVRGLRAPGGGAQLVFDEQQRPSALVQSGWTIEYREYFSDGSPPLPRKVFATRGKHRVRLFIERWQVQ